MPKATRTRPVTAAQVHVYVDKAEEYVAAASAELDAGRTDRGDEPCDPRRDQRGRRADGYAVGGACRRSGPRRRVPKAEATKAVERARRIVDVARRVQSAQRER